MNLHENTCNVFTQRPIIETCSLIEGGEEAMSGLIDVTFLIPLARVLPLT